MEYPDGINTLLTRELDEKGASFSGGQLQRLAIARVLASDADIYILDEPTSNLDPIAERNINKLIIEESKQKTIIIIAHRLSTVVDADKIILSRILYPNTSNRVSDYQMIIEIYNKRIN